VVQVQVQKLEDPLLARLKEFREALEELARFLIDVQVRLQPYAKQYRGYWLERTWVLNKLKKRYFYYYLKSRNRKPRSIYLGTLDPTYPLLKDLEKYEKTLSKLANHVSEILANLQHVEVAIITMRRIDSMHKLVGKVKAKQIPTITEGDM